MLTFHHMAIQVVDLPAMESFYRRVFELPVLERWPDGIGGERSVWLGLDGGFLALEKAPAAASSPRDDARPGHHLVAFGIARDARAAWEEKLLKMGVAIERKSPFSLFFRDPEGNRLALSHHPHAAD